MTYSLIVVGIPAAVGLILMFGENKDISYWLFLALAAFLGAYLWGLLMWHFFVKDLRPAQEKPRHDS